MKQHNLNILFLIWHYKLLYYCTLINIPEHKHFAISNGNTWHSKGYLGLHERNEIQKYLNHCIVRMYAC